MKKLEETLNPSKWENMRTPRHKENKRLSIMAWKTQKLRNHISMVFFPAGVEILARRRLHLSGKRKGKSPDF